MSLSKRERLIAIQTASLYCDICRRGFQEPLPSTMTLTLAGRTSGSYSNNQSEALYRCPEIASDEEALLAKALAVGWRRVAFYGTWQHVCQVHPDDSAHQLPTAPLETL